MHSSIKPTWASPVLAPGFRTAVREVSAMLTSQGIPHALIGGVVLGAYRWPRGTEDIDFLVSESAAAKLNANLLGGEVRGLTFRWKGIDVDLLMPKPDEAFLEDQIYQSGMIDGVPVIPATGLVYLKLRAGRARDQSDIVEVLKRGGVNAAKVRRYLLAVWPDAAEELDSLVLLATAEAGKP